MILKKISIIDYKNIEQAELNFSPKMNCFLGNNGMGKTNLLDAVYYLSFGKSHSNAVDSQNIRHGKEMAVIQGVYQTDRETEDEFFCGLRKHRKKQFKKNKKEYEKLSDHIGSLPLVMVSPADSDLIGGGSEERRKFLDVFLSQFDRQYLHALIRYNKSLQQRNALLKTEGRIDEALLELWEEQLVAEGYCIFEKRKQFVEQFVPTFQHYYSFICGSNEMVELTYNSQLFDNSFADLLRIRRAKDTIRGYTSAGVHRDDLDMTLGGYSIKKTGSQGQNKTYVVAMKLAQFDFLQRVGTCKPILLLDDVFDKLDSQRVKQIVHLVLKDNFGQIFMTDTNREHLDEILTQTGNSDYHIYKVEQGDITQI